MAKRNLLEKKSKTTLLEAITLAVLNDDCSGLAENEPSITPSLAIIGQCWDVPNDLIMEIATKVYLYYHK